LHFAARAGLSAAAFAARTAAESIGYEGSRLLSVGAWHPAPRRSQRRRAPFFSSLLVSRFFSGTIPALAFLDARGNVVTNRSGETARARGDISALEEILRRAAASR